jgi:hypothetical protein
MRAENPGNSGVRPGALDGAERERERERCVSDADASSYGPFRARNDPQHICPKRTHANTTPHHPDPVPLPYVPCYERSSQPGRSTQTQSIFSAPQTGGAPLPTTIYTKRRRLQVRTVNRQKTALESRPTTVPGLTASCCGRRLRRGPTAIDSGGADGRRTERYIIHYTVWYSL